MSKLHVKEITVSEAKRLSEKPTETDVIGGMNFRKLDFVNMEKTCTKKIAGLFGQYERNYVYVPTARYNNSVQFFSIIDDHSAENPTNDPTNDPTLEENPMSFM